MAFSAPPLRPDWTTRIGTSGRRDDGGPVDRRLDRRADEAHLVAVDVGQVLAAGEGVIDVGEMFRRVVAEAADGKRGRDAAAAGALHRLEDHRVAVAGDQLVGLEVVDQTIEQAKKLCAFRPIRPRLVVVAGHEQRHRDVADGVVHDWTIGCPLAAGLPRRAPVRRAGRQLDPLISQVLLDGEGDVALEAGRRQHLALMTRVFQPLDDGSQALRHARGRVADAVVVHQQKSHDRAYRPDRKHVNRHGIVH